MVISKFKGENMNTENIYENIKNNEKPFFTKKYLDKKYYNLCDYFNNISDDMYFKEISISLDKPYLDYKNYYNYNPCDMVLIKFNELQNTYYEECKKILIPFFEKNIIKSSDITDISNLYCDICKYGLDSNEYYEYILLGFSNHINIDKELLSCLINILFSELPNQAYSYIDILIDDFSSRRLEILKNRRLEVINKYF